MPFLARILSILRETRLRRRLRSSLVEVLLRADDRMRDAMGLTEDVATRLLPTGPCDLDARLTPAAAIGAGSFRWAISASSRRKGAPQ